MPSRHIRPLFCKLGGVKINNPKKVWVGEGVIFDTTHPENIILEDGCGVTARCIILTHFKDTKTRSFQNGIVRIKEGAFVGCNVVICKPVTIGRKAIVGAGSIVLCDIPDNELWAGNPARFIKKLE